MTKINLRKYGDSILKQRCEKVEEINEETLRLIEEMKKITIEADGVGLAAPQVGALKRIIIVHPHTNEALRLAQKNNGAPYSVGVQTEKAPQAFVNPKILKRSKENEIEEEGCLSFPGIRLKIKRAKKIEIRVLNEKWEEIQMEVEGLVARIFQHEIDHLNGILFIHRISFFQRWKIRKELRALTNEELKRESHPFS